MEKITTKRQLAAWVGDKANVGHRHHDAIKMMYTDVVELHGRSGVVRRTCVEAEKLRKDAGPETKAAAKTAPKTAEKKVPKKRAEHGAMTDGDGCICLCGCGAKPAGRKSVFSQGHDARLKGMVQRTVKKGEANVFSPETIAFVTAWEKLDADLRTEFVKAVAK